MIEGILAFDDGEWGMTGRFRLRQVRGRWALVVDAVGVENDIVEVEGLGRLGVFGLSALEQVAAVVTISRAGDGELRVLQAHGVEVIDERRAPVVFARG